MGSNNYNDDNFDNDDDYEICLASPTPARVDMAVTVGVGNLQNGNSMHSAGSLSSDSFLSGHTSDDSLEFVTPQEIYDQREKMKELGDNLVVTPRVSNALDIEMGMENKEKDIKKEGRKRLAQEEDTDISLLSGAIAEPSLERTTRTNIDRPGAYSVAPRNTPPVDLSQQMKSEEFGNSEDFRSSSTLQLEAKAVEDEYEMYRQQEAELERLRQENESIRQDKEENERLRKELEIMKALNAGIAVATSGTDAINDSSRSTPVVVKSVTKDKKGASIEKIEQVEFGEDYSKQIFCCVIAVFVLISGIVGAVVGTQNQG